MLFMIAAGRPVLKSASLLVTLLRDGQIHDQPPV
jgi:hypothetical protein